MKTYCNPLALEGVPSGRWLDTQQTRVDPRTVRDYRSVSDPSVVYHDGKWILYPSYSVAYVTEDFVHWKHVDIGVPHQRYSPAVVQFRGKWYLNGHSLSELYVADERFTAYYDRAVSGCARFLRDAVHCWAETLF